MSTKEDTPASLDALIKARIEADRLKRDKGGKEVTPLFTGRVLDCSGTVRGEMTVDVINNKWTLHWEDSGSAWPSSFTVRPANGSSVPTTTVDHTYEHKSFTASAASHDVSACQYVIKYGSTVYGWVHRDSSGTTWYAVPGELNTANLIDAPELEFAPNTTSGSVTAIKVYDAAL